VELAMLQTQVGELSYVTCDHRRPINSATERATEEAQAQRQQNNAGLRPQVNQSSDDGAVIF